jgi:signal transduction histidine kinase
MGTDRGRRVLGWLLAALALGLVATVPVSVSGGVPERSGVNATHGGELVAVAVIVTGFALSGAVLVHLRPRSWIGWILVSSAVLQIINVAADSYAARAITDPDGSLPLGLASLWLASWTWLPSLLLPALVLPALYPTGRPPSRYWVWHIRLALLATGLGVLGLASDPTAGTDTVAVEQPWQPPSWTEYVVGVPFVVLLVFAAVSVLAGTIVRVIRARYPERQQLLWLLCVVAAMVATVFTPWELAFAIAYALVPVAVAVGVLRYRLLGIAVALRRTLVYVPLTLLVAVMIGGLTSGLAGLLPEQRMSLLVGSAVVAVTILPVARWLQVLVDRLVLGKRDPLQVVDRIGAGLQVAHDPVASMLEAVASATGATYAAVRDDTGRVLASVGLPVPTATALPLRYGGNALGSLLIAPARDLPVVTTLAPHLAVVLRSQQLTAELDRERTRVTNATLAERDRLRRDLHDGLGPSLSGIALGLEAAAGAWRTDPAAVPDLLERTRAEAEAAVGEVRRVIDGLRPSVLDVRGLAGAVRDTASALGMGRPGQPQLSLVSDALPLLAPRTEEAAFRIVAEALTNVARHADAHLCGVRLERLNGDLRVQVYDDGCGCGRLADPLPGAGHGLESMRRRAADLGGTLEVRGGEPRGTVVSAILPLEPT